MVGTLYSRAFPLPSAINISAAARGVFGALGAISRDVEGYINIYTFSNDDCLRQLLIHCSFSPSFVG